MEAVLTNLCMPEDAEGRVLARQHLPKSGNPRRGRAFAGGYVEAASAFTASVLSKPAARHTCRGSSE